MLAPLRKQFLLLIFVFYSTTVGAYDFRIAALQFGTVSWELDVIKHHGLDVKYGYSLKVVPVASPNAVNIHLQSQSVDAVVGDWIWVSKQRDEGRGFTSFPYSLSSGEIIVSADSPIQSIADLDNTSMGVAGGPHNKNWLIFNAYINSLGGQIAKSAISPRFVAPPLLNKLYINGEFDSAFNFWHYSTKLKSRGMKALMTVGQMMRELGIDDSLPLLVWIFHQESYDASPLKIINFLKSSYAAKRILLESDAEWERIKPLLRIDTDGEFELLKQAYRGSIPEKFDNTEVQAANRLVTLLHNHHDKNSRKAEKPLNPGTFFQNASIFAD